MYDQLFSWLLIVTGLIALVIGGEFLVRGASTIANFFRIPPLIIGLTVVAFGTSAPELGVSLQAALGGAPDVAVGNVVGSNIFNVLFILGLSALITPLVVSGQLIRLDVPWMIALSLLAWLFAKDGNVGRMDGLILFSTLIAYLIACFIVARRASKPDEAEENDSENAASTSGKKVAANFALLIVGLVFLGLGSKWLVLGAVDIAQSFGVSELIIGLTIVAAGTSLPELVTSVVAGIRGEREIAVGNVVGSNIFNLACVLGLTGIISDAGVPVGNQAVSFDMPIMIVVAAVCLPIFITGSRVSRWEGFALIAAFVTYTIYLIFG